MLEDLAVAIENLDVPGDRDSLVEAIALRDRLDARIAVAVGEFETNGWFAVVDAAASMTAWLRAHARMTVRSAQRLRSLAMRLRSLPVCARAYADGTLSGGQIEAIVARLDDETVEVFAAQEAELVPYLVPLTVAGVSHAMAAWLTRARPEPSEPKEPERALHLSRTLDDRWVLDGSLDPEGGAVVAAALRLATPDSADVPGEPAARRADALVDVCRFFLDHQRSRAGGRHRPHVNVVVELEDLLAGRGGRVVDGPILDGPTVSRLFCDSAVHRVVMDGRSSVLDYGTSTRTIPAPLWNALVIRDEHCRFPGCDRPSVWCEGHHVVWVTQDGTTELANLVNRRDTPLRSGAARRRFARERRLRMLPGRLAAIRARSGDTVRASAARGRQAVPMADDRDGPRRRKIDWFPDAQPGYLAGLELAPPDVQDVIRHKSRWKKQWFPSPTVVRAEDFVPYEEAKRLLQRRGATWSYKRAQADGLVHLVYRCTDGEEGLSRTSMDRELQWRRTATWGNRFRRRVRLLTAPLLGPWRHPTETQPLPARRHLFSDATVVLGCAYRH